MRSAEEAYRHQAVLANYELRAGRKLLFQGPAANARHIIPLAEEVIKRDRFMLYSACEYEGERDTFRIELKCSRK